MNPTPTLNYWPIILVIEDVYVPELAEMAMQAADELGNESLAAIIATVGLQASYDAEKRVN